MNGPSEEERKARLLAYVRQVAEQFRLQAWDFGWGEGTPPESSTMDMLAQPTRWWVRLRVADVFWTLTPNEQRHIVCHEMVHVTQGDLWVFMHEEDAWSKPLAPDLAAMIEARVREECEKMADFLARVIAPNMPPAPDFEATYA